jgi:hypothetical protein
MANITDDDIRELLNTTRPYTVVLLKRTPMRDEPGAADVVREHGRRNMSLRADGVLSIVCPVTDGGELAGVSVFGADVDEVTRLMEGDPGVAAGIFTYEVHPCFSFPGDVLPS